MSDPISTPPAPTTPMLPAEAALFRQARVLVGAAVGASAFYGWFARASRGTCRSDGSGPDGGIETCTTVTLEPSALVYLAVALIVMHAMTTVLEGSATTDAALRTLARARRLVIAIPICSLVLAHSWFASLPTDDPWSPTGNDVLPSLIAWVDIETRTRP
ncbi:hypothetical protein [Agromyces arachidis]|uniref:hypothetical protein n=1 Tax=Agromyces arachidis TaxID=766966 RepID=UPI004055C190